MLRSLICSTPQVSTSQDVFQYTKYPWQAKERTTSEDDSLLSSQLVQLSLFSRHQVHFHLKMKQSRHFLLWTSTQLIQLSKGTSKDSSVHHPLWSSWNTPDAHRSWSASVPPVLCQDPGEQHSSCWLSTNREILRRVSELERKKTHELNAFYLYSAPIKI